MSTVILDQPMTVPVVQGSVPFSIPAPKADSNFSLLSNDLVVHYRLEAPIVDRLIIEDNRITARFGVDDDVCFGLNLIGQSIKEKDEFKVEQVFLFYQIEGQRPRAHFVANTLMAILGLAGKVYLKISELEVRTLNLEPSLLEISKMLHRRQTAYRLMVIEAATGKQFLLPSATPEKEIETIAFVYHAIVNQSFVWPGGSSTISIAATQENASEFAQLVQPFSWQVQVELSQTIFGQSINLGPATVTIEDAVVKNLDKVREQLEAGDGRQVPIDIGSLSGQDKYEFTEIPYSTKVSWEPTIQALIDLEPYLDAAITERYHALAIATLEGLTEEEKVEVTVRPELDEDTFVIKN